MANKSNNYFWIGIATVVIILAFSIFFSKPSSEVVSIDFQTPYKVPQSRQVPFQVTIKNTGYIDCQVGAIWLQGDGFWGDLQGGKDTETLYRTIQETLKPGEQKTYNLVGYVYTTDMMSLDRDSTIIKSLKFVVNSCDEQKTVDKMVTLVK